MLAPLCRIELFKEYTSALLEALAEASRSSSPIPLDLDSAPPTAPAAAAARLSVLGGLASDEQHFQQQQDLRDQLGSLMSTSSLDLAGSTTEEEGLSAEDLAQLQLIRWEQTRLRTEYERMEAKLREMESRMLGGGGSGRASPVGGPPVSPEPYRVTSRSSGGGGDGEDEQQPQGYGNGGWNGGVSNGVGRGEVQQLQHEGRAQSPVLELDPETRKQMEEVTEIDKDGDTVFFKFWK